MMIKSDLRVCVQMVCRKVFILTYLNVQASPPSLDIFKPAALVLYILVLALVPASLLVEPGLARKNFSMLCQACSLFGVLDNAVVHFAAYEF